MRKEEGGEEGDGGEEGRGKSSCCSGSLKEILDKIYDENIQMVKSKMITFRNHLNNSFALLIRIAV